MTKPTVRPKGRELARIPIRVTD
ncbi:hypothetical protein BLAT2472_100157 [Burkholderia latens]